MDILGNGIDLVLHAGDYSLAAKDDFHRQRAYFEKVFCPWARRLADECVFFYIDGNHETFREAMPYYTNDVIQKHNINNQTVVFRGKKIYGLPQTSYFYGWAFNEWDNPDGMGAKCRQIPDDTNILLSHGPPCGTLDLVRRSHVGSIELALRMEKLSLELLVCGHLHLNFGVEKIGRTKIVGCSLADEQYLFNREPIIIEI